MAKLAKEELIVASREREKIGLSTPGKIKTMEQQIRAIDSLRKGQLLLIQCGERANTL
jgi:hypothetical protein